MDRRIANFLVESQKAQLNFLKSSSSGEYTRFMCESHREIPQ